MHMYNIISLLYFYNLFLLCSYSDDKDLNMVSEKFKNMHKVCLSVLQHAAIDTNAIKVVRNLSISTLDTCQDCMY